MESFQRLLTLIGARDHGLDIIQNLPVELSQIIFSYLDSRSLLNASLVSRQWLSIAKSSSCSRQRIRRHIRRRSRKLAQVLPPSSSSDLQPVNPYIILPQSRMRFDTTKYMIKKSFPPRTVKQNMCTSTKRTVRLRL